MIPVQFPNTTMRKFENIQQFSFNHYCRRHIRPNVYSVFKLCYHKLYSHTKGFNLHLIWLLSAQRKTECEEEEEEQGVALTAVGLDVLSDLPGV